MIVPLFKARDSVTIIETPYIDRVYWSQIGARARIITVYPAGHRSFVAWNGPLGVVYEVGYIPAANFSGPYDRSREARDLFHEIELIKICGDK